MSEIILTPIAGGYSFTFKKAGPGTGGTISCCKLNKAKFVKINTPTYHDGMSFDEARTAWFAYISSWQPRHYPSV